MPGEDILPQGRETAPLVVEDAAAGAVDRARTEVAEAERRLMQWEKSADTATRATPFPLTIQAALIGGEDAAIILEGVTAHLGVGELRKLIHDKMKSKPEPDRQRLFIVDGGQEPLEDETLPIGVYAVGPEVTLHLAMQDGAAAAARREARENVRAHERAAAEAKVLRRLRLKAKLVHVGKRLLVLGIFLLFLWRIVGCGASTCNSGGTCSGFVARCTCLLYTSPSPRD